MRKLNYYTLSMAILVLVFGHTFVSKADQLQTENRNLPEFHSISLRTSCNVYIKQGNRQEVRLEGPEEALEKIITEVDDKKLTIKHEDNDDGFFGWAKSFFNSSGDSKVNIYITINKVEGLSVSGSGNIVGQGPIRSEELSLKVSGSGSMELNAKTDYIKSHISGSGDLVLEGRSKNNEVAISGSGKLMAEELEAQRYNIKISGSGSCRIYAMKEIEAKISGSGSIRYRGEPSQVNSKISGSGSVRKI